MNKRCNYTLLSTLLLMVFTSSCTMLDITREEELGKEPAVKPKQADKTQQVTEVEPEQVTEKTGVAKKSVPEETAPKEDVVAVKPLPVLPTPKTEAIPADLTPEVQPAPQEVIEEPVSGGTKEAKQEVTPQKQVYKDSKHFVITVGEKDPSHPAYGKGSKLGFLLDNVPGKAIAIKRGETYEFDVKTNPLHDVYFSTSPLGWGGGTVTQGVDGQFTYKGMITVSPTDKTPDVIYYQCRNHSSMGGKVFVVDKNTSRAEIEQLLAHAYTSTAVGVQQDTEKDAAISDAKVKQKIAFADMMLMGRAAKRITASEHNSAKDMLATATQKVANARDFFSAGKKQAAIDSADEALRMVSAASKLVPSEEMLQEERNRYNDIMDALKNFQTSHEETYERTLKQRGTEAVVDYDKERVSELVSEAESLAAKSQYKIATQYLQNAERIVTMAINDMLNEQTIVYDLNFETAEEEYQYELKRYISYEELIPIAIEQKKPSAGAVTLMNTFVEKGRFQKGEAVKTAKSGDFPVAITMMRSATEQIRRALRIAGVTQ
jgi:hypothetical protein